MTEFALNVAESSRHAAGSRRRPALGARFSLVFAIAALLTAAGPATDAKAQDFFSSLFGNLRPASAPPRLSYADPAAHASTAPAPAAPSASRGGTYCVRLCDGRFFPMQTHGSSANAAQLCNQMCPASQTKTFSGSEIGHASAKDGTRYSALPNAFAFRTQLTQSCTCNGKDTVGLAPVDIAADTTLRTGDIVVTADGPVTHAGSKRTAVASSAR